MTRPAPAPTELNSNGRPRLAAAFAEWMMGLPEGWVTDPAIWVSEIPTSTPGVNRRAVPGGSRAAQLKAIGNGVCPQQASVAIRQLLAMRTSPTDPRTYAPYEQMDLW